MPVVRIQLGYDSQDATWTVRVNGLAVSVTHVKAVAQSHAAMIEKAFRVVMPTVIQKAEGTYES